MQVSDHIVKLYGLVWVFTLVQLLDFLNFINGFSIVKRNKCTPVHPNFAKLVNL